MLSSRVLGLVFLVILPIFDNTIAKPVGSENYSVEEQDPIEQIANVDDKENANDQPVYELQLAVWPEDEQVVHQQGMTDEASVPVYEEQEIVYPALTSEEKDDVMEGNGNIPTWHQTTTTERPPIQNKPFWQQSQTAGTPVNVQPIWQHIPTTAKPKPQEIPIWLNPQNNLKPQVVNVPVVWQQHESSIPVSVSVPTVSESAPATVPVSAPPPPPQNEIPTQIFPDIHFDEAEAIADQQDNADVVNDPILVSGVAHFPNKPKPTKRPIPTVEVIEQYQIAKPDGITEYKVVLSNGMTNYKKIYNKLLPNGKVVTVQEGYNSVPIPGGDPHSNNYQTQYYIADEFGYKVYRVEKHNRRPSNVDYREQSAQI